MPKINFSVPHSMTAADASAKLHEFMPRIRSQYQDQIKDVTENWNGNTLEFSFKTLGFTFKGTLASQDNNTDVVLEIPLAAMMVKGRIEQEVKGGLQKLLK
ncbi:MAG TPA: polyhydroxyalkanoic acid system family protein [Pirellulales bacterium]|nr:polyhydroxyalkanoic acid system family protein [Pirellulales bacterium]